jgi:intracellular sulfur oxidation DsrE/DsrF family protein
MGERQEGRRALRGKAGKFSARAGGLHFPAEKEAMGDIARAAGARLRYRRVRRQGAGSYGEPMIRFARLLAVFAAFWLLASAAFAQDKVVYHIDDSEAQATKAMRNIRNHLDVAPDTKIIVVTHAAGVDFLMEGAKDRKNPNIDYPSLVSALKARGVRFEVCEITLRNRNLRKDQFIMDADFVPSGVVRIGQLQTREGYAYIKP